MARVIGCHERAAEDRLAAACSEQLEDASRQLRTNPLPRIPFRHDGVREGKSLTLQPVIGGSDVLAAFDGKFKAPLGWIVVYSA